MISGRNDTLSGAYGGEGWSPRTASIRQEIGALWSDCGTCSEYSTLRAVLLHRPGAEMNGVEDPDGAQMRSKPDASAMGCQHDMLAQAYRDRGVSVEMVDPPGSPPPNLVFVADLLFGTPEGIILGRPASTVRAGEERHIAARMGALGMPVVRMVRGTGTFEGADAMWVDEKTVLLTTGLRTNREGADQVTSILEEMDVEVIRVGLPYGAMHLMGTVRIVDDDLAFTWPGRVPFDAVGALRDRGFDVLFMPDLEEVANGFSLNFVTLAPRKILMPAGNPKSEQFFQESGVTCRTVQVDELQKACGSIACMTGIIKRG